MVDWKRAPWELRYRYGARLAWRARRLLIQATHRHCRVVFKGPVAIGPGFRLWIPDAGTLEIGAGCWFRNGFQCEIFGDGRVVIGDNCHFTSNALIQCSTSIEIGDRCAVGQSVLIVDGNHRFRDPDRNMLEQGYDYRPIRIGDDVAIAAKCTVVADIGDHCFIGAGSVVQKDLPAYCLAVGSPARPVEYFRDPPASRAQ